jgi:hypothetical protein
MHFLMFFFSFRRRKSTSLHFLSPLASNFLGTTKSGLFHGELISSSISSTSLVSCFSISALWDSGSLCGFLLMGAVPGSWSA